MGVVYLYHVCKGFFDLLFALLGQLDFFAFRWLLKDRGLYFCEAGFGGGLERGSNGVEVLCGLGAGVDPSDCFGVPIGEAEG